MSFFKVLLIVNCICFFISILLKICLTISLYCLQGFIFSLNSVYVSILCLSVTCFSDSISYFFLTWLVHIKKNIETVGKKLVKAACCDVYVLFPILMLIF